MYVHTSSHHGEQCRGGFLGSVEILFRKFEAPFAPSLPPFWAGGANNSSVLSGNPDPGNSALSQLGSHSGGAMPLERHLGGGPSKAFLLEKNIKG